MTTITLPPEIEASLSDAARQQGTTPEALAVETLRKSFAPKQNGIPPKPGETLYDFIKDYIGAVEGSGEPLSENCGEHFTDYLVEKHRKESAGK